MSKKNPESVAAYERWERILAEEDRLRKEANKRNEKRTQLINEFVMSPMVAGMAAVGGWAGARGIYGIEDRKDLGEELNRNRYIAANRKTFAGTDPRLIKAWGKDGYMGVLNSADEVWSDHIAVGTEHVPSDISQAGKFLPTGETIGTVTPEPNSARFATRAANPDGVGGAQSATLWGNNQEPQYAYVDGNLNVQQVQSKNPTVHFSEVDLPKADQVDYQTTGAANASGTAGRGWGRSHNGDTHFGKEYVRSRGRTTANDIYTYLKSRGADVPMTGGDAHTNLYKLTQALKKYTGAATDYKALQSIASPVPTFGDSPRFAGSLPMLDYYDVSNTNAKKAGLGSFFLENANDAERVLSGNLDDFEASGKFGRSVKPGEVRNNSKHGLRWNPSLDDGKSLRRVGSTPSIFGHFEVPKFVQNARSGLMTAAITSPEAAKAWREGRIMDGSLILGGSYVGGEVMGAAINKGAQHLTRKGITQAAGALPALAKLATPLAIRDVMDTGVTLATGKTINEHIVDSDNVGPGIAVSTAPQSVTPVGSFSGHRHTQATVKDTRTEDMKKEVAAFDKKRSDAIKRGGRWKLGSLTVPEFGISESVMGLFGK